jgi:hypothetical protein
MSELLGSLLKTLGGDGLSALGNKAGVNKRTAGKALSAILPSLIHALGKNSSKPEGAEALTKALEKDHDGSILNNIFDSLQGGVEQDGSGILGHIFGKKQSAVETGISKSTGIDVSKIGSIMSMVAPFLMGMLGKSRRENNLGASDISRILLNEDAKVNRRSKKKLSPILQFIDQDGDGEVTDDLLNIGVGFLGKLFKRR